MLKDYLNLLRISNVFTVPPDILAGYFLYATSIDQYPFQYENLIILIFSSIFLYLGGIVSNDIFDIRIDKLERPGRPLPSQAVNIKKAIMLCIVFFGIGIFLAFLSSFISMIIAVLLTVGIISYNYQLKNGSFRPFLMGEIRALNVVYGASSSITTNNYAINISNLSNVATASVEMYLPIVIPIMLGAFLVFCHIFSLTLISSKETRREFTASKTMGFNLKFILVLFLIAVVSTSIVQILFLDFKIFYLISISFFSICVCAVFFKVLFKKKKESKEIDNNDMGFIVKNMVILLILLDSSFVFGTAGFIWGIISSSLIIPCILLGNKIKIT